MPDLHEPSPTERCYHCFRPQQFCICEAIPAIDNQTNVLILQHARERQHRFNTARIVHAALKNSTLRVGHVPELASGELPLLPRAGLLFPGPDARLLTDLEPDERPEQLVILDGTWHHAKTFVRDIPAIADLPRYMIAPEQPGRYRIRREPTAASLSTLEATVSALKILEPETAGLDRLLAAFDLMIERQIAHPNSKDAWRHNRRRSGTGANIPRVLTGDLANVVVAYGESSPGQRGDRHRRRAPVYWVAERVASGECFTSAIMPATPLSETMLGHLELSPDDFTTARSQEEFRAAWSDFLRPDDVLVVYHQSTASLLTHIGAALPPRLILKSIQIHPDRSYGTLEETLESEGIEVATVRHPGRAGQRLAMAVALVRHFNGIAQKPHTSD